MATTNFPHALQAKAKPQESYNQMIYVKEQNTIQRKVKEFSLSCFSWYKRMKEAMKTTSPLTAVWLHKSVYSV